MAFRTLKSLLLLRPTPPAATPLQDPTDETTPTDPLRPAHEDRVKRDAQNCAALLRGMYELDFQIWAARRRGPEGKAQVEDMKGEADARLADARAIVQSWEGIPRGVFARAEREVMDFVRGVVEGVGERRYA